MFLSQPDKPCTGACRPPYVTGRSYPPFAPPDGVSVRAASRPFSASFARPRASVFLKKGAKRHAAPDTNAFYYNTIKSKDCQVFLRSFYKKIFSAQEPSRNAVRRVPCFFARRAPDGSRKAAALQRENPTVFSVGGLTQSGRRGKGESIALRALRTRVCLIFQTVYAMLKARDFYC